MYHPLIAAINMSSRRAFWHELSKTQLVLSPFWISLVYSPQINFKCAPTYPAVGLKRGVNNDIIDIKVSKKFQFSHILWTDGQIRITFHFQPLLSFGNVVQCLERETYIWCICYAFQTTNETGLKYTCCCITVGVLVMRAVWKPHCGNFFENEMQLL